MTLYNVFYIDTTYGDAPHYEVTTDNFEKWLEEHNNERLSEASCGEEEEHENRECTCIEDEGNFDVQECTVRMYNE
tara:strand:+ start:507 stop:734 length:228 start_codon:yes stop_codon:yes gene_type:complete